MGALFWQGSRERDSHNLFCLISAAGSANHEVSSIFYADGGESDLSYRKLEKKMGYLYSTETML